MLEPVRVPTSEQPAEEATDEEEPDGGDAQQPEGGWALDMPAAVKVG